MQIPGNDADHRLTAIPFNEARSRVSPETADKTAIRIVS